MRDVHLSLVLAGICATSCAPSETQRHDAGAVTGTAAHVAHPVWPGKKPDGSVLLPNQWSLRPVGRQVTLGDFPINIAVHPSGRFAAILHSGFGDYEIIVVKLSSGKLVSRSKVHETFYGLEFSSDGNHLFCSGAGDEIVHEFDFQEGNLLNHQEIELRPIKGKGVPAGLALDHASAHLFVANVWGYRVSLVELGEEPQVSDILLGGTNAVISAPSTSPSIDPDTA